MYAVAASPNHAMLDLIDDYLAHTGKSARWLGVVAAKDPRLVPNLRRGQHYPAQIMLGLLERLMASLSERRQRELSEVAETESALCGKADYSRNDLPEAA
jgi:hypothetical protein